ncbi:uridine 5'-monophosphate synthase-like [Castanea sativa]|uniref:uridine 5'-monophosphate synthase-like n=1 Tax=Castanea sativa TaxID=21020 RepID=UPI003F652282
MSLSPSMESLILQLHNISAVKFGNFKLKSRITSPIYIDLCLNVSCPSLLSQISQTLTSYCCLRHLLHRTPNRHLCFGLPPSPNAYALLRNQRLRHLQIHRGHFIKNQTCLIIEDIITSGTSILETTTPLRTTVLVVCDSMVLIDRKQAKNYNYSLEVGGNGRKMSWKEYLEALGIARGRWVTVLTVSSSNTTWLLKRRKITFVMIMKEEMIDHRSYHGWG